MIQMSQVLSNGSTETVPWLHWIWRRDRASLYYVTGAGKQNDDLKKRTMDKTLENTLKVGMNTKFPTCDDKGVFTDDGCHMG